MNISTAPTQDPRLDKVRHEPKVRSLHVERVKHVTPAMLRVTFSGDDLSDFPSLGFDDHVKLLVPVPSGETEWRDYTPRRFSRDARQPSIPLRGGRFLRARGK